MPSCIGVLSLALVVAVEREIISVVARSQDALVLPGGVFIACDYTTSRKCAY